MAEAIANLPAELPPRFWEFVTKTETCWFWTGVLTDKGYGQFRTGGHNIRVHRLAYREARGVIPPGMVLDHICRNRACVNPDHLEVVTPAENTLRGISNAAINARKTHCKHGHEFTEENTYYRPRGGRGCKECRRAAVRRWRAAA